MVTRARFERATDGWRRRSRGLLIVGRLRISRHREHPFRFKLISRFGRS